MGRYSFYLIVVQSVVMNELLYCKSRCASFNWAHSREKKKHSDILGYPQFVIDTYCSRSFYKVYFPVVHQSSACSTKLIFNLLSFYSVHLRSERLSGEKPGLPIF